jgi:isoleucyl-tRNA synthetase
VSHFAVLCDKKLKWPADLYLEGSDQHRGWFQSSILTAVGARGRAPYDAVLTHGFTVDEAGKKMSKSLGNVVDPQKVVEKYGADTLRLWVVSADFRDDMSASDHILKNLGEAYGKIRNTCRFLISNLNGFDPSRDAVPYEKLMETDRWALLKLSKLIERVRKAYDEFEFHIVFHSIRDFCVSDLSALYLDIAKDRLYCSGSRSIERMSCQTVLHQLLKDLAVLLAPIFSFTSEDIWKHVPGSSGSIFLAPMPSPEPRHLDGALQEKWDTILKVREEVYRVMEGVRASKDIAASLEADVAIYADKKTLEALRSAEDIASLFICSDVRSYEADKAPPGSVSALEIKDLRIIVKKALFGKCERCWNLRETVGKIDKHRTLCEKCAKVVDAIK